jgi:hypothetical protein
MIGIGRKTIAWRKARRKLKKEYEKRNIVKCEWCGSDWALSFHHLEKRSSGKAKHTFEDTRLLCTNCHDKAEHNKEFNEKVRKLRWQDNLH